MSENEESHSERVSSNGNSENVENLEFTDSRPRHIPVRHHHSSGPSNGRPPRPVVHHDRPHKSHHRHHDDDFDDDRDSGVQKSIGPLFKNLQPSRTTDMFLHLMKYTGVTGKGFLRSIKKSARKYHHKPDIGYIFKKNNYIINYTLQLIDQYLPRDAKIGAVAVLAQYYVVAERDDMDAFTEKFEKFIEEMVWLKKLLRPFVPFQALTYIDVHIDDMLKVRWRK
ncbi:unnamed protein product [Bursaphelenchus okinawaensis]|uniref:Uncharacterized protein n=1 Tax=Bursaphelenchus okinawaensis TaxID=465554 RepID=A0A811JV57_9BILA|nr:unnamed protein product [Bursaphelenchus okinawaensis]CAG9084532.1 unnamed protein product [Bursaphelenchus okinawaensis]